MLTFTWLRRGTSARDCKDAWMKEQPLTLQEGGTTTALSAENFEIKKDNLKEKKGCLQGLGNLSWLSNELAIPGARQTFRQSSCIPTVLPPIHIIQMHRFLKVNPRPRSNRPVFLLGDLVCRLHDMGIGI